MIKAAAVRSDKQTESKAAANAIFQKKSDQKGALGVTDTDNHPEPAAAHWSSASNTPAPSSKFTQSHVMSPILQYQQPIQTKENKTGLPDNLKSGIENLSGYSMDDVEVHYNSDKPAQLQAHAHAQGTDIHVASGQKKHLAHEAWHVMQQKQGRVKPTMQMKGNVNINDDAGLEKEAAVMEERSLANGALQSIGSSTGAVGESAKRVGEGMRDTKQRLKFLSTLMGETAPLQRTINLNGETNPDQLWKEVTNRVKSRYKRKQTLYRWAEDSISRNYTDAQTLANDLDLANAKGGALGRGRPAFSSKLTAIFNQTHGGTWHRRHIIMSSLMRDAVYATTEANMAINGDNLLKVYNKYVSQVGGPLAPTIAQAEANLVYVLHNNPANLVIDQGDWNSAIGAFAHNVKNKLEQDQTAVFIEYQQDKGTFFDNLVRGFQPQIQQQIATFWQNFEEPTDVFEFTDLLETMYDNAAVDLMSNKSMPQHQNLTAILLQTHGLFVATAKSGDLNTLENACIQYIYTGTQIGARVGGNSVYYKDIL